MKRRETVYKSCLVSLELEAETGQGVCEGGGLRAAVLCA